MFLLRIFIASLALAASLHAGDRGPVDSSVPTTASQAREKALANKTDSTPENDGVGRPNAAVKSHPASPETPSAVVDTGSSDTMDFPQESSSHNPWLYIIVGFLLVTGFLLYVDPRIF